MANEHENDSEDKHKPPLDEPPGIEDEHKNTAANKLDPQTTDKAKSYEENATPNAVNKWRQRKEWGLKLLKNGNFWYRVINLGILIATYFIWRTGNDTFKEVKKQFKAQHQSFLQITKVDTFNFKSYKNTSISYEIRNLGTDPAKIQNATFLMASGTIDTITKVMIETKEYTESVVALNKPPYFINDSSYYNRYVTKESPVSDIYTPKRFHISLQPIMETARDTNNRIYFFGQVFYQNQMTGDNRKYTFGLQLVLSEKYKTIMYVNEDTLVKVYKN